MQNFFSRSLLAVTAGLLAGGSAQALEVAGKALEVYGQVNIYAGVYKTLVPDANAPAGPERYVTVQHTALGDNQSRLGGQGQMALGSSGLTAIYQIESSVWNREIRLGDFTGIGNRELMVGIKAGEHTVQAVRGETVYKDIQNILDPFQGSVYGLGVDHQYTVSNTLRVAALRYVFGNAGDGIHFGVQWGKVGNNSTATAPPTGSDTSQGDRYLAAKLKFTDKESGAWGALAYNAEKTYAGKTTTGPAFTHHESSSNDIKRTNMLLAAGWSNVGEAGTGTTAAAGFQMNSWESTSATGITGDYSATYKSRQIFLSGQYDEKDWAVRAGWSTSLDNNKGGPDGLKQPHILRMAFGADYKFDKNTLAYFEYVNEKIVPGPVGSNSITRDAATLGMQYKF